jgi:tetratricopeptide (TPR) repeat protein
MLLDVVGQKKLLALSILFETSAVGSLFLPDFEGKVLAFLVPHFIASVLLSEIVWALLPKKYKKPFPLSLIALFVIIFFTPVISYSLLAIFYILLRNQKTKEAYPFEHLSLYDKLEEVKVPKRKFGEAAVRELVYNRKMPTELRLKVFSFLAEVISPETVQLLKIGIKDPNDEIRMLCISELKKLEERINKLIHMYLKKLEEAKTDIDKLDALENLAKAYWEYIYYKLPDEDMFNFYLNEAYKYCLKAIEFAQEKGLQVDPHVKLILGKIYLIKGDLQEARKYLEEVLKTNIPKFKVALDIGEIYYNEREFDRIKKIFKRYPYLKFDYYIYPIYLFWRNE